LKSVKKSIALEFSIDLNIIIPKKSTNVNRKEKKMSIFLFLKEMPHSFRGGKISQRIRNFWVLILKKGKIGVDCNMSH